MPYDCIGGLGVDDTCVVGSLFYFTLVDNTGLLDLSLYEAKVNGNPIAILDSLFIGTVVYFNLDYPGISGDVCSIRQKYPDKLVGYPDGSYCLGYDWISGEIPT